jgi:hypothetical protein
VECIVLLTTMKYCGQRKQSRKNPLLFGNGPFRFHLVVIVTSFSALESDDPTKDVLFLGHHAISLYGEAK